MSDECTYVEFERVIHETVRAILFEIEGAEVWLPKSQILDYDTKDKIVIVPEWVAKKKDLEGSYWA